MKVCTMVSSGNLNGGTKDAWLLGLVFSPTMYIHKSLKLSGLCTSVRYARTMACFSYTHTVATFITVK